MTLKERIILVECLDDEWRDSLASGRQWRAETNEGRVLRGFAPWHESIPRAGSLVAGIKSFSVVSDKK